MKKILLFLFLLILPFFSFASEIAVFHTSDTHGFYYPRKIESGKTIGGFALAKGYIDSYSGPYLLLDSGDFSSGTLETKQSKGSSSVNIMNAMGYAATTIGNHENDFKEDAMLKNLKNIKFDVLGANVYDLDKIDDVIIDNLEELKKGKTSKDLKNIKSNFNDITSNKNSHPDGIKPYKIYEIGGKKIAVIGIAKELSKKGINKIIITDGRKEIKKALSELKAIPHDATILLIHNSLNDQKHENQTSNAELIKGLEHNIDLVLGGHAHIVLQKKYKGVQYVESGSKIEGLSEVILTFNDKTGKLTNIRAKYVELDSKTITPNKAIEEIAEQNRIENIDTPIGKSLENIMVKNYNKNELDSPLGNLFADIIKEAAPKADFALHNTGAVRVDILKGDITKRVIINAFPFPNKVMLVKVNGSFIKNFIEGSIQENKSFFQYSNNVKIEYRWKNDKAEIVNIKINDKNLNENKIYVIAVNDYMAMGNEEGLFFKKINDKKLLSEKDLGEIFVDYLKANPQGISAPATGRIKRVK